MGLPHGTGKTLVPNLLLAISVSAVLLALLIRFTLSSADTAIWPHLLTVLTHFSFFYIIIYVLASIARTFLQALRYRLLLAAADKTVPSLFHIILVTLSRNMFVDVLPARLGELSYIAMLSRGYRVSGQACVSSLAVSFVFDLIGLAVIILALICFQLTGGAFHKWTAGILIILVLVIMVLLVFLFPALKMLNRLLGNIRLMQSGIFAKGHKMFLEIQNALHATAKKGLTLKLFGLSVGIRILKYFSLFCLFTGVVKTQFPQIAADITSVLPALISAEAGASMPVPAFLGFGTYEASGTLALIALGASKAASFIIMLAIHIISQVVDYFLGTLGFILFLFKTAKNQKTATNFRNKKPWIYSAICLFIMGAAILFLVYEYNTITKRGSVIPPDPGKSITLAAVPGKPILDRINGFIVWSSNRSGNHDIYLYSLPERKIKRLTTHPHTEYFPRISPDGKQIVFARSQIPWVSQRNYHAWDIWLLDLETGKEILLAPNGNTPTWSANGKYVYFQRNGNEVIELHLKKMKERLLHKAGTTLQVSPETILETPNISSRKKLLAVTLRKTMRATAIVTEQGNISKMGKGCQLTWGPGDKYLYKIDHGGKMQNAIFKIDAKTHDATKWFDAPGDYSHEYFPRVSNLGNVLVYGASKGDHTHDSADYEIFLWDISQPAQQAVRITHHTGNDCWPDVYLYK